MKKRHEQKLIILSIALMAVFNIPLVFMFSYENDFLGMPVFYFFIFLFWALSVIISYTILKRHYE